MSWRQSIAELPQGQQDLLRGGGLSQRFINWPLDLTHPALIGALYGLLVGLALLLPIGQFRGWEIGAWWNTFLITTLMVMLLTSVLGLLSRIIIGITLRPPMAPPRRFLYPMPFIGLAWLTLDMTGLLEVWVWGGWILLILPGPIYNHVSWAPRWRLLCRLEAGLDPFEGTPAVSEQEDTSGGDEELAEVVARFDDEE